MSFPSVRKMMYKIVCVAVVDCALGPADRTYNVEGGDRKTWVV